MTAFFTTRANYSTAGITAHPGPKPWCSLLFAVGSF